MRSASQAEVVEGLLGVGALKLGDFVLSSGKRSGYYLDLRLIPSHPHLYKLALDAYREMAERLGTDSFEVVAGVATSGLLMASPLAVFLGKPLLYVRNEEKGHGTRRLVEGEAASGSRALLVDDLATSGGSLAESVSKLRAFGLRVTDALVLVDRLEGASSRLHDLGVRLTSFITVEDIAPSLKKSGAAQEEEKLPGSSNIKNPGVEESLR